MRRRRLTIYVDHPAGEELVIPSDTPNHRHFHVSPNYLRELLDDLSNGCISDELRGELEELGVGRQEFRVSIDFDVEASDEDEAYDRAREHLQYQTSDAMQEARIEPTS